MPIAVGAVPSVSGTTFKARRDHAQCSITNRRDFRTPEMFTYDDADATITEHWSLTFNSRFRLIAGAEIFGLPPLNRPVKPACRCLLNGDHFVKTATSN